MVTVSNEIGEVIMCFHVVTDSHDQIDSAIETHKNDFTVNGHSLLIHIFTDKPFRDKDFVTNQLPSLKTPLRAANYFPLFLPSFLTFS